MTILTMSDLELKNKRVLIREDLNVPLHDGEITSDIRIRAAIPTIQHTLKAGAKVIVTSHLGRPTEGEYDEKYSLAPVAKRLQELLHVPVVLEKDYLSGVTAKTGEVVLCENVRFNVGEKKDDEVLAKKMAALCDVFVMDAFATAHRAQASTHGIAKYAKEKCAGLLLSRELQALDRALAHPTLPMIAIVGGSKVSGKLNLLEALSEKTQQLIVGGGIANTFIAAAGFNVGKSLYEKDLIDIAKSLIKKTEIPIPTDVVVAKEFSAAAEATIKSITQVVDDDLILDIGPETAKHFSNILTMAGTIVWNGPVGVFEIEQFSAGTKAIAEAVAASKAFSIAGGGDTLAAIEKFKVEKQISYISTGGGAFLEFVEGKTLPAVAALEV